MSPLRKLEAFFDTGLGVHLLAALVLAIAWRCLQVIAAAEPSPRLIAPSEVMPSRVVVAGQSGEHR